MHAPGTGLSQRCPVSLREERKEKREREVLKCLCELDLSLLASSALTNGKVNICDLPYRGLRKGLWFLSNLWPCPAPVPTLGSIYVLWTSKARLPLSTTVCAPWSVPSKLGQERPMLSLMGIGQVCGPRAVELDWSPLTSCCVALPWITLRFTACHQDIPK